MKRFVLKKSAGFEHLCEHMADGYDWLQLGSDDIVSNICDTLENVFRTKEFESEDHIRAVVQLMLDPNNLAFVCKHILNINLIPEQMAIIDTLWRKKAPLIVGGRGSGKSWILSVYCLLRMLLNPGCKIVVIGAALRQSRNLFDTICTIYDSAPILHDIVSTSGSRAGPHRETDRFEFKIGTSTAIFCPTGDGSKIRGYRANYIIADEFHSQSEEIFNVVIRGFGTTRSDPFKSVVKTAKLNALEKKGLYTPKQIQDIDAVFEGNQIILAGTAYYHFNHFYKEYSKYKKIIQSKGDPKIIQGIIGDDAFMKKNFNWRNYAIIQIAYSHMPEDYFDEDTIAQSKASMSSTQFHMEYSSRFCVDSDGFFKRLMLESATCNRPIKSPNGEVIQFVAMRRGESKKRYVIGVDPAAHADNAAVVVLEYNPDHRKIVHCWATNKKTHSDLIQASSVQETDYYRFIARKIRNLMAEFSVSDIAMDRNGGGTAIAEALADQNNCKIGEIPIYPIPDPNNPTWTDAKEGLHMITLLTPNMQLNAEANHGMKKDFEEKALIFPMFDQIEVAKQSILDEETHRSYDTYDDLVFEVEALKDEITNIVCTATAGGTGERFDTPEFKVDSPMGKKKGRFRKDRYSALLYANWLSRNFIKNELPVVDYKPMGGLKQQLRDSNGTDSQEFSYYGAGMQKFKANNNAKFGYMGEVVRRDR